MILTNKVKNELTSLQQYANTISYYNSITDIQLEKFLKLLEQTRYNLLSEIKIYNNSIDSDYEMIKTIDQDYKASFENNMLKIYIPEVMPSFKNIKTHTHKRIMQNIAKLSKPFEKYFENDIFIYIKIFDRVLGWDVDNKYIKPISDGLILSGLIEDDNLTKMSYMVKGEFSETPHTEIYVYNGQDVQEFLDILST